jgi:hypothetical protein
MLTPGVDRRGQTPLHFGTRAGVMGSNHARVLAGPVDIELVGVVDLLPAHRVRVTDLANCRTFDRALIAEGVPGPTIAQGSARAG